MFTTRYSEIEPFITPQANACMRHISGDSVDGDMSIVALLRAFLFERLPEKEGFSFHYRRLERFETAKCKNPSDWMQQTFGPMSPNNLVVCSISEQGMKAFNDAMAPKTIAGLAKEDYEELTVVSDWVRNKCKIESRVIIRPQQGSAYLVVQNVDLRYLHLFMSLLPKYLPKFFADKPIQEYEHNVLKTLTSYKGSDFLAAISVCANHMNLREPLLRGMVLDFEKREQETMLRKAKDQVSKLALEIESAMERYMDYVRRHQEQLIRVEGIKASIEQGKDNSDLLEYLVANKNVDLLRINGNRLEIEIRTHLDIFDPEMWKHYAKRGEIYRSDLTTGFFSNADNCKLLIDAIFAEDPVLRLKLCGYYCMGLDGHISTDTRHTFRPACNDYMVNPHLSIHACLGNSRGAISAQLASGEIIGAIECCMGSCKSVNMSEVGQTIRPMIRDIYSSKKKIIRTNDGQDLTPEEAVEWLKKRAKK